MMASGAGHAGDLTPEEAVGLLTQDPSAVLVDVRTAPEWDQIGVPDAAALPSQPIFLEWLLPPAMAPNTGFEEHLRAELAARGAGPDTPLMFLCRSGARSAAAADAATAMGYSKTYNILGGFEGSPGQGYPGWKRAGLPWTQR